MVGQKVVSLEAPSPGILARWLSEYADVVEFRIPVIRVLQVEEDGFGALISSTLLAWAQSRF